MKNKVWTKTKLEIFNTEQEYLDSEYKYPNNVNELKIGSIAYGLSWNGDFQKGKISGNIPKKKLFIEFENEHGMLKSIIQPIDKTPESKFHTERSNIYFKK